MRLNNDVVVHPRLKIENLCEGGCWYYLKCGKTIERCEKTIESIFPNNDDLVPVQRNLYVAFLTQHQARSALKHSLKLEVVGSSHKRFRKFSNSSKTFLLFTSTNCTLPFEFERMSKNIALVETPLEVEQFIALAENLKCVRAIDQLNAPRLDLSIRNYRTLLSNNGWASDMRDKAFRIYGLDGTGQTASIVDTGVDVNSCWFADRQQEMVYNIPTDHRKIKAYFTDGDGGDVPSGHGSFVAGIIAGRAVCDLYKDEICPGTFYDGVAPNADLIVHDVYLNNTMSLWNWSIHASARSRSLSAVAQYHGFDFQGSSLLTYMFDGIAYENSEMLFVFPAGDRTEQTKPWTVPSPGDSKNALTVGALSGEMNMNELDDSTPVVIRNSGIDYIGYCDPNLGVNFYSYITENPDMLKESYTIGTDVLILVPAAFDLSVVHMRYKIVLLFNDHIYRSRIDRPVIRMPAEARGNFNDGDKIVIHPFHDLTSDYISNSNHKVERYGVVKPDILLSGGPFFGPNAGKSQCGRKGVRLGEGSSVSAALAVGYSLLIRQFIGGTNGPLLRAVFAHFSENKVPNLEKLFAKKPKDVAFFNGTIEDGHTNLYTFQANQTGSVKVTIAWNDPPHDPLSPSPLLFDIELMVSVDDDFEVRDTDPFTTVKSLTAEIQSGDKVQIRVRAKKLVHYPHANYSLVITGPFLSSDDVTFIGTSVKHNSLNESEIITVEDGQNIPVSSEANSIRYFKYQFSKWGPGHTLQISVNSKTEDSLFSMFSVGELPTLQRAHCTSDYCPWATTEGTSFTLGYSLWDFIQDDSLYVGVYSKTNSTYTVSIGHAIV